MSLIVVLTSIYVYSSREEFLAAEIGLDDIANREEDTKVVAVDSETNTENINITTAKEFRGSVGEFHDILKEQTGKPAKVLPFSKSLAKKYRNTACNATRKVSGQKNKYRKHKGYDFGFKKNQAIYVVYSGTVSSIHKKWYKNAETGKYEAAIYIKNNQKDDDGARYYSYGHLNSDRIKVKDGQKLKKGDLLGYIAYDHLDIKKSARSTVRPSERICNGGTIGGLPKSKYKVW